MLKLAVFDLDGTLKQVRDPYVYVHERLGKLELAEEITSKGLNGQISYETWLRLDAELWMDTSRSALEQFFREDLYVPGAEETIRALKARDVYVVIISSGLLFHAQMVAEELGVDAVYGNEILFKQNGGDWVVSGEVRAHVPFDKKAELMARIQAEHGISSQESIAVGDTRSDIPMFERAEVGVAIYPNHPAVSEAADIVLSDLDMRPLLARLQQHAPHLWEA
jgi:phosphoserine phosphatase